MPCWKICNRIGFEMSSPAFFRQGRIPSSIQSVLLAALLSRVGDLASRGLYFRERDRLSFPGSPGHGEALRLAPQGLQAILPRYPLSYGVRVENCRPGGNIELGFECRSRAAGSEPGCVRAIGSRSLRIPDDVHQSDL
jgi:hypothetical protein